MNRWCIAASLLLAVGACDTASSPADSGPAPFDGGPPVDAGPRVDAGIPEDLDGYIEHWMAYGGIPGAAIAIVTPTGVALTRTYGFADIEAGTEVDANTLFIMASISKTIAAVRAMQLVEDGLLDLDEPVGTYLGYELAHPLFAGTAISTRMLLTHTSGMEDVFSALGEATYSGDPTMTLDEFTRAYALEGGALYSEANWDRQPGTRRSYCNAGYGVVGQILERAGGAPFPDQTEATIFSRVDMDGTGWFLADVDTARIAIPYGWNGRRFSPLPHNGFAYYPASSLRISIRGLARFAQMILGDGEIEGARVLEASSVEAMLTVQYPTLDRGQAITFSERNVNGHRYIGHSGSTFGGSTQMLLRRGRSHAILLITNSDAYIRSRVIMRFEGRDAMEAILARLDEEAAAL